MTPISNAETRRSGRPRLAMLTAFALVVGVVSACSSDDTPPALAIDDADETVVQEQVDRSAAFNLYGTGETGAKVEVSFEGETATTTVVDGQWRQEFNPPEAGTYDISVVSVDDAGNRSEARTISVSAPAPPADDVPLTDPDVVVLGMDDGPDVDSFDSQTGTMSVTGEVRVGDVLVSEPVEDVAPYGLAQVVESVDGGSVTTRPASLPEVIRRYRGAPELSEATVRGRSAHLAPAIDKVDTDIELGSLDLIRAEFAGDAAGTSEGGSVSATGSVSAGFGVGAELDFGADFDIDVKWHWFKPRIEVNRVGFGLKPQMELEAWAKAAASASYTGKRDVVKDKKFPSLQFTIGFVPIVLTPGIDVKGTFKAAVKGNVSLEADLEFGIDLGVVYSRGETDVYAEPFAKWQEDTPFEGEASATFDTGLPIRAEVLLYSTVGPYFRLTPGIKGEAEADIDALTASVKVTGYLTGDIGLRAELLGKELADIDKEVAKYEHVIYSKEFAVGKAAELAGTWSGNVTQTGGPALPAGQSTFEAKLTLPEAPDGDVAGSVQYSIGCTGELRRQTGGESTSMVFDERITSGAESCVESGTVTLEPLDNAINYTWQGTGEWQDTTVTGILQR